MADHHVYVIGRIVDGELTGPVKIGVSGSPKARLKQLQTGHPDLLVLAHVFNVPNEEWAYRVERGVKALYASERLRGEWFDMPPAHAIARIGTGLCTFIHESAERNGQGPEFAEMLRRSNIFAFADAPVRWAGGDA